MWRNPRLPPSIRAHRLINQTVEAATRRRIRPEAESRAVPGGTVQGPAIAQPRKLGDRYPHQVLGGQLQRVIDRHGDVACARTLIILRTSPTTRSTSPPRSSVLSAMPQNYCLRNSTPRRSYITHDLAVVAQIGGFHSRFCAFGAGSREAPTGILLTNARAAPTRSRSVGARAGKKPRPRARTSSCRSIMLTRLLVPLKVLHDVNISIPLQAAPACAGGGRVAAPASPTNGAAVTGLLPPTAGQRHLQREPPAASLKDRNKDQLQRNPDDLPDGGHAMNPRQTVFEIIGRPLEFYLRPERQGQWKPAVIELLKMISLRRGCFMDRFAVGAFRAARNNGSASPAPLGGQARHHHLWTVHLGA